MSWKYFLRLPIENIDCCQRIGIETIRIVTEDTQHTSLYHSFFLNIFSFLFCSNNLRYCDFGIAKLYEG